MTYALSVVSIKQPRLRILTCVFSLAVPTWAAASPVIYSCRITQAAPEPDIMNQVDQVIIDVEGETLELRVARTMGTSDEVNWTYGEGAYAGDAIALRKSTSGVITGAGLRDLAAYAFSMNGSEFLFSHVAATDATLQGWTCER